MSKRSLVDCSLNTVNSLWNEDCLNHVWVGVLSCSSEQLVISLGSELSLVGLIDLYIVESTPLAEALTMTLNQTGN